MPDTVELVIYAIINYVPYMILALLPFEMSFRFSKTKTAVIMCFFTALIITIFVRGYYAGYQMHILSTYLVTFLAAVFYFICVRSRWGRMLFNLFMIKNVANFVVVAAKCLEGYIFPDSIGAAYSWTNSLCMLIVLVPLAPVIIYIVNTYFSKKIRDAIDPVIWRTLWLVPVFFYGIWLYAFYYSSSETALELALKPESAIFMIFFLSGQLLIYICIARLVIHFNKSILLEEENHRLSNQYLQYRCIQDHIQEISRVKHDFHHHLVTISHYVDADEYDKLKEYLNQYIVSIPRRKILYCANAALNMVLVYYGRKCQDENISFKVSLNLPDNILLSDADTTVLFGNLLENAVDACINVKDGSERRIIFAGKLFQNRLVFAVENTFINDYRVDSTGFVHSTKHEGYGVGTASVRKIVYGYGGTIDIAPYENNFSVSIIFPFADSDQKTKKTDKQ